MQEKIVTFCYRKIMGAQSKENWELQLLEDTYHEFKMQFQYFNQQKKYNTFEELRQHVPGSERLHFLVSAAAVAHIKQLGSVIPDIVDNIGKTFLPFDKFNFEIISSDIGNKLNHQVAIQFYSDEMNWHETVGEYMLLSCRHSKEEPIHLYRTQPFVNIHSFKNLFYDRAIKRQDIFSGAAEFE